MRWQPWSGERVCVTLPRCRCHCPVAHNSELGAQTSPTWVSQARRRGRVVLATEPQGVLMPSVAHAEIQRLRTLHQRADLELTVLQKRAHWSADDEHDVLALKRLKLRLKD